MRMNINELINAGANVSITISPADLEEFALSIIDKMKQAQDHEQQTESYMTPDEVARVFDVTKNTLWRWDKIGYLKPVRCGRRLHYKRSDVTRLLDGYTCPAEGERRSSHPTMQHGNCKRKGGAAL